MEDVETTERSTQDLQAENERLQGRVRELEAELLEVQARANAAVASGRSAPTGWTAGTWI